jgi:hypothetical protein
VLNASVACFGGSRWRAARRAASCEPTRSGVSTIQRWYYEAKNEPVDPVSRLRTKVRTDAGQQTALSDALKQAIHSLYTAHRSWTTMAGPAVPVPEMPPVPGQDRRRTAGHWLATGVLAQGRANERERARIQHG